MKEPQNSENDENNYDPYQHRVVENPMSNLEVYISLLKASIGIGCLAMPKAFQAAGWLNGLLSTALIGSIVIFALHVLLHGMYELSKRKRVPQLNYPDSMAVALESGPKYLRFLSETARSTIDFILAFYHFGVCCAYVVFIADNMKELFDFYGYDIDSRFYIFALTLPLSAIYLVRDLRNLVPFNAVADAMICFSFVIVFYYIFTGLPSLARRSAFGDLKSYPLFFGTVLFAIESVGVIISVEAKMKSPRDYLAFFGYWRYGDRVKDSITSNLPMDEFLPRLAKLMFAVAIFLSFALQGYITIEVCWRRYSEYMNLKASHPLEYVLRIAIVLGAVLAAVMSSELVLILSLVGSFSLSYLGLIFPGLMDFCLRYSQGFGPYKIYLWQDLALVVFGFVGGAIGTWFSIRDLFVNYQLQQ
ncbi:proton-coupled amino acid transporter-like protein CG1139 isoform X2 [Zeugodacus cucurbitae]|uniref:proton-coupled amino acid transporter-like protein CG1139 isoform X2 n=1 Tax=Zeugodacus cucurbitae TaxID=28588 RepID=UPI0005969A71|nr:proton-coupled amino acid transporter-like protein CG1139 isoform X2 [Zeugodacus cucurbitae]